MVVIGLRDFAGPSNIGRLECFFRSFACLKVGGVEWVCRTQFRTPRNVVLMVLRCDKLFLVRGCRHLEEDTIQNIQELNEVSLKDFIKGGVSASTVPRAPRVFPTRLGAAVPDGI